MKTKKYKKMHSKFEKILKHAKNINLISYDIDDEFFVGASSNIIHIVQDYILQIQKVLD